MRRSYEAEKEYSEHMWSGNMYVLYALSKFGIKDEIEDSYKVMLRRALATKDTYQLALLANASANLGKHKEYEELMMILEKQYETGTTESHTTFTGSGVFLQMQKHFLSI